MSQESDLAIITGQYKEINIDDMIQSIADFESQFVEFDFPTIEDDYLKSIDFGEQESYFDQIAGSIPSIESHEITGVGSIPVSDSVTSLILSGKATSSMIPPVMGQRVYYNADGSRVIVSRVTTNTYTVSVFDAKGVFKSSNSFNIGGGVVSPLGKESIGAAESSINKSVVDQSGSTIKTEKLATALQEAYPDKKVLLSHIEAEPTVHISEDDSWLERQYDSYIAPVIKAVEKYGEDEEEDMELVGDTPTGSVDVTVSTNPIPTINEQPPSTVPVDIDYKVPTLTAEQMLANANAIEAGEEPPYSEVPKDALTTAVMATGADMTFDLQLPGGNIYPVTDEEKRIAAKAYLDRTYPDQAGEGQNNELICKYFWNLVPQMSQSGVEYRTLAEISRKYESIIQDDLDTYVDLSSSYNARKGYVDKWHGGQNLSTAEQKDIVFGFNQEMIEKEIPAPAMAMFNAGLAYHFGGERGKPDIQNWMTTGGLNEWLQGSTMWVAENKAKDWLTSDQGMAALGAGVGILGTAGAFMAAGPIGGIGAMGTLPFQTTEFIQTFGEAAWKTKGELQLSGEYSQDHVFAYNTLVGTASDAIKNIGFAKSLSNPSANLQNIKSARDALEETKKSLRDKWQYLEAANVYNEKVRGIRALEDALEANAAMFDAEGNFIAKDNPPITINVINADPTWKVTYGKLYARGDGDYKLGTIDETFIGDVTVEDSNGNVLGRMQLKSELYGGDKTIDAASIVAQAKAYERTVETKEPTVVAITVPAGSVMTKGSQIIEGGLTGVTVLESLESNEKVKIVFSKPGFKDDTLTLMGGQGTHTTFIPTFQVDAFASTPEVEEQTGFDLQTSPDAEVWINGKRFYPTEGKTVVPVTPGIYSIVIKKKGKKDYAKNITIYAGQKTVLSDPAEDEYVQKSSSGGGGGGGGGGGSSKKSSATKAKATTITYGETCRDAKIWQDEIQVEPEIDKQYAIEPGYHSIRMTKTGKQQWIKTVYAAKGDDIYVSPAFLDEDVSIVTPPTEDSGETGELEETKIARVFVNSDPSGAKVLINGGSVGEWTPCYLDLPYGYYTITISKTGYAPYDLYCYATDIIAWGSEAQYLARLAGWL
ncbi:TPA_asm: hypothetical protein vir530_00007 [dsDNA virus vir530]|nr:TPA_asm: hypothetical protein vir530_00007 [dsDNA virus vir530]